MEGAADKVDTELYPENQNFLRTSPLHMPALRICIFVYDLVRAASTLKLTWDTGGVLEFVCPPHSLKMPEIKTLRRLQVVCERPNSAWGD